MALSSMTCFARSHGASGPYTFEWELKSVNAKGFDLRVRLPQGFDELEAHAKKRAGERLARGTVYANLNVKLTDFGFAQLRPEREDETLQDGRGGKRPQCYCESEWARVIKHGKGDCGPFVAEAADGLQSRRSPTY